MGLSRTVAEINGDFRRKSHIFPTPVYFAPPLKRIPLELGTGAGGQQTRMMGLSGRERSFSLLDTIHERDRETDGQTETDRQQSVER